MAENQFDINAHLQQMGFGQKGSGDGGSGSGEAMTPDSLLQKGLNKTVQNISKLIGLGINPDIEGKSALAGFENENVGSGFSLSNLSMFKDLRGGVLASIFNYFTREIPKFFTGDEGGGNHGGDSSSSGGSGDSGGGSSSGEYYAGGGGHGGHGELPGFMGGGGHHHGDHGHDMKVSYGDKLVSAEALMGDLGQLRPSATPNVSGNDRDYGMSV